MAMELTYDGIAQVRMDAYSSLHTTQFYRLRIGENKDDHIISTVTDSEIQIREWITQARERINASRCIGLTIKTAQRRNGVPRAVICAFSIGNICLIVRLPKKSKAIPLPLSEFLLQNINVFAGIKVEDSLHILMQGIKGGVRSSFCDISGRAVERYNEPALLHANQCKLAARILNKLPPSLGIVDSNFDKCQLAWEQVEEVTIDSYLAHLMGKELLGPEQGIKEEKKVKMEKKEEKDGGPEKKKRVKIEEEESGGPEKKVEMEKKGGGPEKKRVKTEEEESGGPEKKVKMEKDFTSSGF